MKHLSGRPEGFGGEVVSVETILVLENREPEADRPVRCSPLRHIWLSEDEFSASLGVIVDLHPVWTRAGASSS